ncbi:MAG: hypothetical protein J5997_04070 [Oscillospiraceae bacterium]|nr:hypothetical protein [Oscillospiraceae bacterium]
MKKFFKVVFCEEKSFIPVISAMLLMLSGCELYGITADTNSASTYRQIRQL